MSRHKTPWYEAALFMVAFVLAVAFAIQLLANFIEIYK